MVFIPGSGSIHPTSSRSEIPDGAVMLSEAEIVQHQYLKVTKWRPLKDVCMLAYGDYVSAAAAGLGGFALNNFFRRRFKLKGFAWFFTTLPVTVMPFILAGIGNGVFIRNKILLGYYPCEICAEIRSGVIQVAIGSIYPSIATPICCAAFARQHLTLPVLSLIEPNKMAKLVKTIPPSFGPLFTAVLASQFIIGGLVAGSQLQQFHDTVMKERFVDNNEFMNDLR